MTKTTLPKVAPPTPAAGPVGVHKRSRGYLPHWEKAGSTYFVTFRLADSLPTTVLAELEKHKCMLAKALESGRALLPVEALLARSLGSRSMEAYLDAGSGECLMRRADAADIVAQALRFGEGTLYDSIAWCVMPNHVHAVFCPRDGHSLGRIIGGWKSISARRINTLLNRRGTIWQREYFDRLIRSEEELDRAIKYVQENPSRAALGDWRWVHVNSGC